MVWDRHTGRPVHNAIVWQDTRFEPAMEEGRRIELYGGWRRAVERCLGWEKGAEK